MRFASRMLSLAHALTLAIAGAATAPLLSAQTTGNSSCNQAAADAIALIKLPGSPFTPLPSADGCWLFVTMPMGSPSGVAVIKRDAGKVSLIHVEALAGANGAALTSDGKVLVVTAGAEVVFFDVERLTSGARNPSLGSLNTGAGSIYVVISADDHFAFVADERSETVAVIDLATARSTGFKSSAIVGRIPVGNAPVGLALSPDGHYLYSTSEAAPARLNWAAVCTPEANPVPGQAARAGAPGRRGGLANPVRGNNGNGRAGQATPSNHVDGALMVIDVALAERDPAHAVLATVPAECNPVRVLVSPTGDMVYVSARHDDALIAFDASKLLTDAGHALLGKVHVGASPVGLTLIDSGHKVVVANSNRFGGRDEQVLTVVDAAKIQLGGAAVVGSIPAGEFPRELRTTADGHTLLLANFTSGTVEMVDLARLELRPPR